MMFIIIGGKIMNKYEKELAKALKEYFDKKIKITKNMTQEEEKKYIKENNKEEEVRQIYQKLKEKYEALKNK